MKNIRKYMMAAACMTAAAALVACTEAVKRDTEEEIQEMTVPKKPGPITKVPATLTCNGGEEFTFSVSKVQWAETYEWTIAEQEKSKISIIDGQGTNVITVRVVNDDVVIPAQSVSVVAKKALCVVQPLQMRRLQPRNRESRQVGRNAQIAVLARFVAVLGHPPAFAVPSSSYSPAARWGPTR